MSYREQLKATINSLGVAQKAARDKGLELGRAERGSEAHATLKEEFGRAKADMETHIAERDRLQDLIAIDEVDTSEPAAAQPPSRVPGRAISGDAGDRNAVNRYLDGGAIRPLPGTRAAQAYNGPEGVSNEQHNAVFTDAWLRSGIAGGVVPMHHMLNIGENAQLEAEQVHALLSTDDVAGGFTVPEDFRAEFLTATAGFAVVRSMGARVVQTIRAGVTWPTVNPGTDPYSSDLENEVDNAGQNWKAEGHTVGGAAPPTQSRPTFGSERIPVHIWQPDAVEITQELLDDSAMALDGLIASLFAEVKALDEDRAFIRGNGNDQPEGIINGGSPVIDMSEAGAAYTYGGMVNMFTGLPAQYRQNAKWAFNSATLGIILKLEDTQNRPLFPINALPGSLMTKPFGLTEFLDDFDATDNAVIHSLFGDWSKFVIVERRDLTISRLIERFAPNLGLLPTARVGGQLTVAESFRLGAGT